MSDTTGIEVDELPQDDDVLPQDDNELPPQKVLTSEDLISHPFLSADCTIPKDILEFQYSFGYDCLRHFNLCVVNEVVLIFTSGNIIHFYNTETSEFMFRRSAGGGGLGHVTVNPKYPHVAVAENGDWPLLVIYEWPSFEIVSVLHEGTEKLFVHLDYSPNGELLLSAGGEPDYQVTIWDWKQSTILLRGKSYGQDIINAMFSRYIHGHLTTSGYGHIKFWKMVDTFTGLKIKGALGRFGKTEICDIIGFLALPDERVISGCAWGNMLLWEDGLIKVEVCRKNRQPCHGAPITQFVFESGELTTIGLDGKIKLWYFETIDLADPPEDDRFVEMEPMFEFEFGDEFKDVSIMCIEKMAPHQSDNYIWYAQDANGGIWKLDLNVNQANLPPERLYICHAGAVIDMATSPCSNHIATLGIDGQLFFYNYETKQLLMGKRFPAKGGCLLWLPVQVAESGNVLMAGFSDGMIRVLVASIAERENYGDSSEDFVTLIQILKPHSKPVTSLSISEAGTLIVSGSEDSTVFVFGVSSNESFISLVPWYYVEVPSAVTYFEWKPNTKFTILVSCTHGHVVEVNLPQQALPEPFTSYKIQSVDKRETQFSSIKSQIRRDILLKEITEMKEKKLQRKKEELKVLREENPTIEIDEETYLADSEEEEEMEPLYIPPEPNPVLFATYINSDVICLSMGGYDSGYTYQFKVGSSTHLKSTMITDADDIEIDTFVKSWDKKYLIFGMQDGKIRINRTNEKDPSDFSNYWLYSMHDNNNGVIQRLCFSYDHQHFFSCGMDGNIFCYTYNPKSGYPEVTTPFGDLYGAFAIPVEDVDDPLFPTLEETMQKKQLDIKMEIAEKHKNEVKAQLSVLAESFQDLLKRNNKLYESQRLKESELELDPRITADLNKQINTEMALMERKLAFEVEKSTLGLEKVKGYFLDNLATIDTAVLACRTDDQVTTFRQRKLSEEYYKMKQTVERQQEQEQQKEKIHEPEIVGLPTIEPVQVKLSPFEQFLKGLPLTSVEYKLNIKLQRLLEKYNERKQKKDERQAEWDELKSRKPDPNTDHIDDINAYSEAVKTIGDYKLKTSKDYRVPQRLRVTTVKKLKQCLEVKEEIFLLKDNFNQKVFNLRNRKVEMIKDLKGMSEKLITLAFEIGEDISNIPEIPKINERLEFPEKSYELKEETVSLSKEGESQDGEAVSRCPDTDDLEREVLTKRNNVILEEKHKIPEYCEVPVETMVKLCEEDHQFTPWELELQAQRKVRLKAEHDFLLRKMQRTIEDFDMQVSELKDEKISVEMHSKFKDLHLLQLDLELLILKDFEDRENYLSEQLVKKTSDYRNIQAKIKDLELKLEQVKKYIEQLVEREKNIHTRFEESVAESTFADFLRKIYKKKYKPPKVVTDDDEEDEDESTSSEESTTDEDDDDLGDLSIESAEFIPVKLDESVCPPGCDEQLYNQTFELRSKRHKIEQDIQEEKKNAEALRKELENSQKKEKVMLDSVRVTGEDLEAFQFEKQQKLNEVDCLVTLNLEQMKNFTNTGGMEKLCDSLVFSQQALKQMEARVDELNRDTDQQHARHRTNRRHLHRMRIDCNQMSNDIARLREDIKECMIRKFGREISMDELEEAMLRKLVADMGSSVAELQKEYDLKIAKLKEKKKQKVMELFEATQENTEKLNLLTILEEEKQHLEKLLRQQAYKMEHPAPDVEEEYRWEVAKLSEIASTQTAQIMELQREIKKLGMKCRPSHSAPATMQDGSVTAEGQLSSTTDAMEMEDTEEDVKKYLQELINDFANYRRNENKEYETGSNHEMEEQ